MTSAITTAEAREHFSEIINRTAYGKKRIVIKRRGKDVVAIVPLEDLELLEKIEDEIDLRDAKKALKETRIKGSMSLEKFIAKLK